MRLHQHLQTVAVGGDKSAKAPLLPEYFGEQPIIDMGWNAINLVVGRHHAAHMTFLHRSLKRQEKVFTDDTLRIVSRRGVGADRKSTRLNSSHRTSSYA